MYKQPQNHYIEYTNQSGEKITMSTHWDADLSEFVKMFYMIIRHASFTHKTAVKTFNKEFKQDIE